LEQGVLRLLVGSYNIWLVLTSLGIAILASYTALDMAGRIVEAHGRSARRLARSESKKPWHQPQRFGSHSAIPGV
jgi:hypothetical protein